MIAGVDLSVGSENIGGPASLTFDWSIRPADIFTLDLRKNVFLAFCGFTALCHADLLGYCSVS